MSNKTNIYNSGIQGYTIKGKQGLSGDKGYNIYYSVYNINSTDYNTVINLINNTTNNSLDSSNTDNITYKENDVIIDCKGRMYFIKKDNENNNLILSLFGSIVNQTENDDSVKDIETVNATITVSCTQINNPYKSVSNTTSYERYFDLYQEKMNLFNLNVKTDISDPKLVTKLVIIHKCGLTQEYDLESNDCNITIYDKVASLLPGTQYKTSDNTNTKINYLKDCLMYIDVYSNENTNSMYRFPIDKNNIN